MMDEHIAYLMGQPEDKKLRAAALLIESVAEAMDMGGKACTCCGTMRRFRWNEYKAAMALGPIPKRLKGYAELIGG
tara:strand:- start:663 stop:890 length:228 start_codon:yes stop_codon:yes gene_type:complete